MRSLDAKSEILRQFFIAVDLLRAVLQADLLLGFQPVILVVEGDAAGDAELGEPR